MSPEARPADRAAPDPAGQRPIEDHAVLGDTRTAALVNSEGSIVWLCAPRFDSPPIFGALVAGPDGGRFAISPIDRRRTVRRYRDGSAVLETVWESGRGRLRLTEGMIADLSEALLPQLALVRRLECLDGEGEVELVFDPRRDFGETPRRSGRRWGGFVGEWGSLALLLRVSPDLEIAPGRAQRVRLRAGERITFVLSVADRAPLILLGPDLAWRHLESTDRWWRSWSGQIHYEGSSPSSVERSLITLRLLTYAPSGAPVAAPTTSLPEEIGGRRNWDYRYSWCRDASLGAAAFLGVGMPSEAETFLRWLGIASRLTRPAVQVLYDLDGRPGVPERERWDLPGYAGSLPVRLGNAACNQHQLDVYGWIVEAAWQFHRSGHRLGSDLWAAVRGWADFVCRGWREPDAGIWEGRSEPRQFVHSKVMGWQALDRALSMAQSYPVRRPRLERWKRERSSLAAEILRHGIHPRRDIYVQAYGSEELDAALLMVPSVGLEPPDSPRVGHTVEAIRSELSAGDGLLRRYIKDELDGGDGAFLACSFWLVRALSRLGRVDEAGELFESLCRRANDVGLFAEEIDPATGGHLGNFPQALTHSSLVQAALSIVRASPDRAGSPA